MMIAREAVSLIEETVSEEVRAAAIDRSTLSVIDPRDWATDRRAEMTLVTVSLMAEMASEVVRLRMIDRTTLSVREASSSANDLAAETALSGASLIAEMLSATVAKNSWAAAQ